MILLLYVDRLGETWTESIDDDCLSPEQAAIAIIARANLMDSPAGPGDPRLIAVREGRVVGRVGV